MISLVRVALLFNSKACDAAFLSIADPAIEPNTMGFLGLLPAAGQKITHFFQLNTQKQAAAIWACERIKYKQINMLSDLMLKSPSAAMICWRAQEENTATLVKKIRAYYPKKIPTFFFKIHPWRFNKVTFQKVYHPAHHTAEENQRCSLNWLHLVAIIRSEASYRFHNINQTY